MFLILPQVELEKEALSIRDSIEVGCNTILLILSIESDMYPDSAKITGPTPAGQNVLADFFCWFSRVYSLHVQPTIMQNADP